MKPAWLYLLAMLIVVAPFSAHSQSIDRRGIWASNKQAVVKIIVTGQDAAGNPVSPRRGTGVIVRSNGTIVTALHVVGRDDEWKQTPAGLQRRIEVFSLDDKDVERPLGIASAKPVPSIDVALLSLTASNLSAATVSDAVVDDLAPIVAIIWDPATAVPRPVSGDLEPTDKGKYGDNLTVVIAVLPGHSGSGVFDTKGHLVGVVTNKLDEFRALAIPVHQFTYALPKIDSRPSEEAVARCEAELRKEKVDRQPFTETGRVRCENMGDEKRGSVTYTAPPGYSIVGSVKKEEQTNYGSVSQLIYEEEASRVVRKVNANLHCKTPDKIFGPGGWASATLKGFIEKVLPEGDLASIRVTCLARR